jgi:hypothetical protein
VPVSLAHTLELLQLVLPQLVVVRLYLQVLLLLLKDLLPGVELRPQPEVLR